MRVMKSAGLILFVMLTFGVTSCFDKPDGLDTNTQLLMDMQTIDEYLVLNGVNAYYDKTGIRFAIDELGTGGFPPRTDQLIKIKYTGKLMNGSVFDSRDAQGVLNTFIPGWQYCLSVWPAGTKGRLWIPSPLAYGTQQTGSIPPNSILAFDIELKEVVLSSNDKSRFTADTIAINNYIATNKITDVIKDSTGIRYKITAPGEGPIPNWYTKCKFHYTGKALANQVQFFDGDTGPSNVFDSRAVDYIHGIKFGLQKIAAGGKITLFIPSGLAFGTVDNSSAGLPPNSVVIYDLELQELIYD